MNDAPAGDVRELARGLVRAYQRGQSRPARRRVRHTRDVYIETVFGPDDALPWGPHAGTRIRDLPLSYLEAVVREGLRHPKLYGVIYAVYRARTRHRRRLPVARPVLFLEG